MAAARQPHIVATVVLTMLIAGCAARPLASQQTRQLSVLSRTSAKLQAQLATLQAQLRAFASPIAPRRTDIHPAPTAPTHAAAEPLTSGYQRHAAASAAQRHAASVAAVAAGISSRTFKPASTKGEHKTMMLKPDGSVYTKTFQWDGPANVDLQAAAAALQPRESGDFAAAATTQMGSLTSQQSACDGCIGADTRAAVPAATVRKFPYTAVGMLTADSAATPGSANPGSGWCTGAMISPRHVLTAAHCVWDVDTTHAAKTDVKFAAGRDGAGTPFGNIAYSAIRLLEQFQGQTSYTDTAANTDFAVITLAEPVGKRTGWMGLTYSTATDEALDITTAGFPDDKAVDTMWSTTCPHTMFHNDDPTNHVVEHNCDSTHGQSGSPMWTADNNVRSVLTGGQGNGINWALRIDDFVFSTILGWMQEDGEFAGVGAAVTALNDVSGAAAAAAASGGN